MTDIETNIIQWAVNQGFAVIVAAYLMIRIEQKLDTLIKKIDELCLKLPNYT